MTLRDLPGKRISNPLYTSRFVFKCSADNFFENYHDIYDRFGNRQKCIYDIMRKENMYKPNHDQRRYSFAKTFRNFFVRGLISLCGLVDIVQPIWHNTMNRTIKDRYRMDMLHYLNDDDDIEHNMKDISRYPFI